MLSILGKAHGELQLARFPEDLGHTKGTQGFGAQFDAHFEVKFNFEHLKSIKMSFESLPAAWGEKKKFGPVLRLLRLN